MKSWKCLLGIVLSVMMFAGGLGLQTVHAATGYDKDNLGYILKTVDFGVSVLSAAQGQPKLLVFYKNTCPYSQETIQNITSGNLSGVDIVAIESANATQESTVAFQEDYGDGNISFCYKGREIMWQYVKTLWGENVKTVSYPVIVYIDANNKIQYMTESRRSLNQLVTDLGTYCGYESQKVTSITLSDTSLDFANSSELYSLTATVSPENAVIQELEWESSNTDVAVVTYEGLIVTQGYGTATITARATDGSGVTATCEVRVGVTSSTPETTPSEPGSGSEATPSESGNGSGTTSSESGSGSATTPSESGSGSGTTSSESGTTSGTTPSEPGSGSGTTPSEPGSSSGTTSSESGNGSGTTSSESGSGSGTTSSESGNGSGATSSELGSGSGTTPSEPESSSGATSSESGNASGTTSENSGTTSGSSGTGSNAGSGASDLANYTGWHTENGKDYWYENGVKQGIEGRGKEIFDPSTNAWYWLDAIQGGAKAVSKDVYQESDAGIYADREDGTGKWVRYDENGHMIKGWNETTNGTYYFDPIYGTMVKGYATIDGTEYYFNIDTGVLERNLGVVPENGWKTIDGKEYWYEGFIRQGYSIQASYRGKEIYDAVSDAWYWLDNVQDGARAVSKDVYQESDAGIFADREDGTGKWVRYDASGHMIKGWCDTETATYYFDPTYGSMAKGWVTIDGNNYHFDETTGMLQ